jgi:hypothetical protein
MNRIDLIRANVGACNRRGDQGARWCTSPRLLEDDERLLEGQCIEVQPLRRLVPVSMVVCARLAADKAHRGHDRKTFELKRSAGSRGSRLLLA